MSELVRPHITIVFSFEMDITNEELSIIIENRFKNIESFIIEMQGFSKCEDRFGNYLFLNVVTGMENITQLNDAFNSVKDNEAVFKSRITKISVEMIGENEESIIIIEKQLC